MWENVICTNVAGCAYAWLMAEHVPVCSRYCVPKCPSYFLGYYMMWQAHHCDTACVFLFWTAPLSQNDFCKFGFKIWHYVLYPNLPDTFWTAFLWFWGFSHFSTLCRNSNGHLDLYTLYKGFFMTFQRNKLPPPVKILELLLNRNASYIVSFGRFNMFGVSVVPVQPVCAVFSLCSNLLQCTVLKQECGGHVCNREMESPKYSL